MLIKTLYIDTMLIKLKYTYRFPLNQNFKKTQPKWKISRTFDQGTLLQCSLLDSNFKNRINSFIIMALRTGSLPFFHLDNQSHSRGAASKNERPS